MNSCNLVGLFLHELHCHELFLSCTKPCHRIDNERGFSIYVVSACLLWFSYETGFLLLV